MIPDRYYGGQGSCELQNLAAGALAASGTRLEEAAGSRRREMALRLPHRREMALPPPHQRGCVRKQATNLARVPLTCINVQSTIAAPRDQPCLIQQQNSTACFYLKSVIWIR